MTAYLGISMTVDSQSGDESSDTDSGHHVGIRRPPLDDVHSDNATSCRTFTYEVPCRWGPVEA